MASILPSPNDCCNSCKGASLSIVLSTADGFFAPENMTTLRQIANQSTNRQATLEGYATPGDGQGGVFFWSPNSTAADNDSTIIKPNDTDSADPGRWIKLL